MKGSEKFPSCVMLNKGSTAEEEFDKMTLDPVPQMIICFFLHHPCHHSVGQ
jgi:hypothetical protein